MTNAVPVAESLLNALAARLEVWRPGAYAGSLYAQFVEAQRAVAAIDAANRETYHERLTRLAAQAGITLAPSAEAAPIASINAQASLIEMTAALAAVEPPATVRQEAPSAFSVWCAHLPFARSPPPWLMQEIAAGLRHLRSMGVVDNYVLLPAIQHAES